MDPEHCFKVIVIDDASLWALVTTPSPTLVYTDSLLSISAKKEKC
jgi:hypothetical protein